MLPVVKLPVVKAADEPLKVVIIPVLILPVVAFRVVIIPDWIFALEGTLRSVTIPD